MGILDIFSSVIKAVLSLFSAPDASASTPEPGNPRLPTVSQSRKIPLAVGRTMVTGPNVIEATKYITYNNKEEGTNYYQNIEFAIAYGPGLIYSIWSADLLVWDNGGDPLSDNGETIYIAKPGLWGDKEPGGGGMRGDVVFCRGDSNGYIFPDWETLTGREQPGYPMLSRALFKFGPGETRGFAFGNSENYRPVEFEYGFFPNPLNHATNHSIGSGTNEAANPAYVLYENLKSAEFGTSSQADVDVPAISAMAATLYIEGLGIRRTWYTESATEIEEEVLDLIDGVRYRDPLTGFVVYKLLRDDYTGIPTVTDSEIVDISIAANSLSSVPNKISVTYLDGDTHYKEKKLTETNIASRLATGHDIQKDVEFLGAGDSATAGNILTREVRKESKPRRSGKVILNRIAWDWSRGDTFIINSDLEGIVSLPVRVLEHKRNNLDDRRVTIEFIEEVFVANGAVFDTPVTGINDNEVAAVVITDFTAIPLPRHLYRSGIAGFDIAKFGVIAADPTTSNSMYIELLDGSWIRGEPQNFANPMLANGAFAYNATTLSVVGSVSSNEALGVTAIDAFKNILIIVRSATEYEFLCYQTSSLNSATGVTTFTGCSRGLYGPQPLEITSTDKFYQLNDLALIDSPLAAGYASQSYRLVSETGLGEATTTTQSIDSDDRSRAPQAPGYFGINGDPNPAAQVGSFTIRFRPRNYEHAEANGMVAWDDTYSETLGANESMTLELWDKTNSIKLLDYPDAYVVGTEQTFRLEGLTTKLEGRAYVKDSVTGFTSPDVSKCVFDYAGYNASVWYAASGGIHVIYRSEALQAVGLNRTSSSGEVAAVNTYPVVSGKYYFEVFPVSISGTSFPAIGVVDETAKASTNYSGTLMAVQTPAVNNHGGSGNVGGFAASGRICVAVDIATRKVWIRKNNDAWAGGGDPETGVTPFKTLAGSGAILPYVDVQNACSVYGYFTTNFNYSAPVGFNPWGPLIASTGDLAVTELLDTFVGLHLVDITGDLAVTDALDIIAAVDDLGGRDAYFFHTQLLLSMGGVDASTTFTDSSDTARPFTAVGDAQIDTAQSKFGGSSALFDGAGDYIHTPYIEADFDWWTEDFTLELQVRAASWADWASSGGQPLAIGNRDTAGTTNYWSFGPTADGTVDFYYYNGANQVVSSTEALGTNEWVHLAMEHRVSDSSISIYIAGAKDGSGTVSGTPQSSAVYTLNLGQLDGDSLTGWIDDVRITKGTLRYGTDFTPPVEAHPTTAAFTPSDVTTLELWLDAADKSELTLTGTTVDTWGDKSGNAYDGTKKNTPVHIPGGRNGLDVIRFTQDAFTLTQTSWGDNVTVFSVTERDSAATANGSILECVSAQSDASAHGIRMHRYTDVYKFGVSTDGSLSLVTETPSAGDWTILKGSYDGTTIRMARNGDEKGTSTAESGNISYTGVTETTIGEWYDGSALYEGDMAEILIYSSAITQADYEKVEGYLSHKWGIPLISDHAYETYPPGYVFDTTSLFNGGEAGAFLDFRDTGTLWQDTGGVTQADTALDSVRRADDLSGNGNNATYSGTTAFKLGGSTDNWYLDTQDSDDRLDIPNIPSTSHYALILDKGTDSGGVLLRYSSSEFVAVYNNGTTDALDNLAGTPEYTVGGVTVTNRDEMHDELNTGLQPKILYVKDAELTSPVQIGGYTEGGGIWTLGGVKIYGCVVRDTAFTAQELTEITEYFNAN